MPLHISRNRLYQVGAVLAVPPAIYNFVVWFGHPDQQWETQYVKSFTGAVSCSILCVVLLVLSFSRKDTHLVLCGSEH